MSLFKVEKMPSSSIKNWTPLVVFSLLATFFLPTSPSAQASPPVRIAIAYDIGGLGDNSFNDATGVAVAQTQKKLNIAKPFVREIPTDGSLSDRIRRLRFLGKAGYELIIAVGNSYSRAVAEVSIEYPEIQFAIIDGQILSQLNVSCLVFSQNEAAYVAGFLASKSSVSNKIGFFGEASTTFASQLENFIEGAQLAKKGIEVQVIESSDTSAEKLLNATKSGVDVIYSIYSADSVALTAVMNASTKSKRVWLIARTPDDFFVSIPKAKNYLLATIEKNLYPPIYDVAKQALSHGAVIDVLNPAGIYGRSYGFKNGGLEVKYSNAVSGSTKTAVNQVISTLKKSKKSK